MLVLTWGRAQGNLVAWFNGEFAIDSPDEWGEAEGTRFIGCHALLIPSRYYFRGYFPIVRPVDQNIVAFNWETTTKPFSGGPIPLFLTPIGPSLPPLEEGDPGSAARDEVLKSAFRLLRPGHFKLKWYRWRAETGYRNILGYPSRAEAGEAARLVLERGFEAVRVRTWAGRRDPQGVVVQTGPATGAFMPASRGELEALGALARKALGRPPRVAILEDGRRGIALLSPYPLLLAASGAHPRTRVRVNRQTAREITEIARAPASHKRRWGDA